MSARFWFAPLILAVAAFAPFRTAAPPSAEAAQNPAQTPVTTTLDDQAELAVTIYNSDLALVRDVRNIQLTRGTADLHFMDIAGAAAGASRRIASISCAFAKFCRTRFKSPATSCSFAFLNEVPLPFTTVTQPSRSAVLSSRATVST